MTRPESLIALDFGLRNIGVAVGNSLSRTAQPLTIVSARDGVPDWSVLTALTNEWKPDRIIVGHPLNMDGSASELSQRASKFARQVEGRLGRPVTLVDERLSSREAKALALSQGHHGDFAADPIDDHAAAIILTTWLNDL
ncbi:MAG: Holliday junction resolvase RuvX [Luminiphilus sp.]|jgi:putative Holliday junction resolvase|nr:Holliday junction resolvase RuvX [Luminiphilus sp.]MBT6352266.1 Holliday junction resolvase RuvX [Halieaceae bacterium]MCH1579460.1 Holliday junction resolvase RuvX [Luminiphilus sp.]MDA8620157.1 Holliday junction resolvase RuvX [Luminiphilus sp.]MDB2364255.1 Holliday junction resolvase RuvX [Luminiphilus sp.]